MKLITLVSFLAFLLAPLAASETSGNKRSSRKDGKRSSGSAEVDKVTAAVLADPNFAEATKKTHRRSGSRSSGAEQLQKPVSQEERKPSLAEVKEEVQEHGDGVIFKSDKKPVNKAKSTASPKPKKPAKKAAAVNDEEAATTNGCWACFAACLGSCAGDAEHSGIVDVIESGFKTFEDLTSALADGKITAEEFEQLAKDLQDTMAAGTEAKELFDKNLAKAEEQQAVAESETGKKK